MQTVEVFQRRRLRRLDRLQTKLARSISRLAIGRVVAFLVWLVCGTGALIDSQWLPYGPIALTHFMIFVVAVRLHRRPFELEPRVTTAIRCAQERSKRLQQDWSDQDTGAEYLSTDNPEWQELRLFGRGSAFQQINRSGLARTQQALANQLQNGLPVEDISDFHENTRALGPATTFRRRMEIESRLLGDTLKSLDPILNWAESETELGQKLNIWRLIGFALAVATGIQLVMTLAFEYETLWSLSFGAQVLLFIFTTGKLSPWYAGLLGEQGAHPVSSLVTLFRLAETRAFSGGSLEQLQASMAGMRQEKMFQSLQRFRRIIDGLAVKHSPMLHSLLGIGFCWELYWATELEKWRRKSGAHLRGSVDALVSFEILLSAAGLVEEMTPACFPRVLAPGTTESPMAFEGVGHPSLPAVERQTNDFEMKNMGELNLVTGSNMSGKSTFLRTLGMNVLLGQAGFAVCAQAAQFVKAKLLSSIQVVDQPEAGLSRFHAEVLRLKRVLDSVKDETETTFYLIDEMLSGTNSRERQIACRTVLKTLSSQANAFGLVTTHDLALAEDNQAQQQYAYYHFADRFDGNALHFDYVLKPGVAVTTNALHVLALEGIEVD